MIIDTRDSLPAKDLLQAIRFADPAMGSFVVQRNSNNKLAKMKIHSDQAEWLVSYLRQSQYLSISTSTFRGSDVLPNFFATKIVSVAIDLSHRGGITKQRQLFAAVCEKLAASMLPIPSAVVVTPHMAMPLWVVDEPYYFSDLGELYTTEHILSNALEDLGSITAPRCASRFIPLPTSSAEGGVPSVLLGNGAIKGIARSRLTRMNQNSLIPLKVAEFFARQSEVIEELGCLLHARSLDISGRPECYWAWMSGYGAAASPLVEEMQTRQIIRQVAVSLAGAPWANIKNTALRSQPYQYQAHEEMIMQSTKGGVIKLGEYMPINDDDMWPSVLAGALEVRQDEIESLRLHRLVPSNLHASNSHDWSPRERAIIGNEEYLSAYEFFKAA